MQKSLFEELQKQAALAKNSTSLEEGMTHLANAFSLFSEESKRLSLLHQDLKNELKRSKERLCHKISELNMITEFLHNILGSISQGILFINLEGVILSCNPAAEKILQVKSESLLYKKFWNHFPDRFFSFSMQDALDYGVAQPAYYQTIAQQEIEVLTSFVFEGASCYHGIIILLRDVTQIQKLQLLAARDDRMKQLGEMISTVTHEIKNPLGGIKGYATLLQRDLEGTPQKEMVEHILDGIKTLENFVTKVLLYARPIEVHPVSTDFSNFLKKLCKFIKVDPSFPKNIQFAIHISEEPFFVPIDTTAMKSALMNLFVNAHQAMPEGGVITVSLMKQNQNASLTIVDSGVGIEEKDQEKIFTPFFTTKSSGNGLGLPEAHRIITAHFGQIEVRSQLKKGTTFTITLPLQR